MYIFHNLNNLQFSVYVALFRISYKKAASEWWL